MTVCVAALFQWNYAPVGQPPDYAVAALTVSDRMLTAGNIKYEPDKQKLGQISEHVYVMVAGDYDVHSEAIKNAKEHFKSRSNPKPFDVAIYYGIQIQAIQRRHAEAIFLAPLGLNTDSFLAQQKDLSDRFVDTLTTQLQTHHDCDVQAIVVGLEDGRARIYSVDHQGLVRSHDDVGFLAVGSGAWHAQSAMMLAGYANTATLSQALTKVYAAKKAAEIAPGVGESTDIWLFLKTGVFQVDGPSPVWRRVKTSVDAIYTEHEGYRTALHHEAIKKLQEILNAPPPQDDQTNVTPITSAAGTDSETA